MAKTALIIGGTKGLGLLLAWGSPLIEMLNGEQSKAVRKALGFKG